MNNQSFFETLFTPTNWINTGSLYTTTSYPLNKILTNKIKPGEFYCLNPLTPGSTRSNQNIESIHNLLFESDFGTLNEQADAMSESGLPFTAAVYSGNKSLHWIISIKEPFTLAEYKAVHQAIRAYIQSKFNLTLDKTNDPARLSRTPGFTRPDTGKEQKLLFLGNQIKKQQLIDWFELVGLEYPYFQDYGITLRPNQTHHVPSIQPLVKSDSFEKHPGWALLSIKWRDVIRRPQIYFVEGSRNNLLYQLARELSKFAYDPQMVIEWATANTGLDNAEIVGTVRSAYGKNIILDR